MIGASVMKELRLDYCIIVAKVSSDLRRIYIYKYNIKNIKKIFQIMKWPVHRRVDVQILIVSQFMSK